jgi:type I restriction enzyme S subunit
VTQRWAHKALEELLSLNRSGYWGDETPSKARPIEVKVIRNADLTKHNSIKGSASRYFSPKEAANAELQIGDIAMSSSGDVGKAWLVNEPGYSASNFIRILRPNGNYIMPSFLRYVLESEQGQVALKASTAGTTIQNLKKTFYSMLTVPLPPLAEQQQIVRLLDEVFEGIAIAKANAEKNLKNTRALFERHLHSIYSEGDAVWPAVPLGEICDVLDNLRKPVTKRDRVVGPYPYYGATGVVDHVANFLFDEPLVLVGEDGAKWGPGEKSAFLVSGKVWVNNHAHVVRPHRQRVLDQWLVFYLTHIDLNEYVSGLTVPKLNQGSMREIPIPLPKIAEQQLIVDTLKELEASVNQLAESYAAKLRACEELSSSLLNQAFSGDLKAA